MSLTDQEHALIDDARALCYKTRQPQTASFDRKAKVRGKDIIFKYSYTYEFDGRGIPYAIPRDRGNLNSAFDTQHGAPSVFLAYMSSNVQETLEKMDRSRVVTRRQAKDTRTLNKKGFKK